MKNKPIQNKEKTLELRRKGASSSLNKLSRENKMFQRNSLQNRHNEDKMYSDIGSMISQDELARVKEVKQIKEESKGKLSNSEEKISFSEKDECFEKNPYMNGIKINDNFDPNSDVEYFYEFGKIPYDLAGLMGKMIGKAMFEDVPISPRLNHFLLKGILGQDFELEDLKTYDPGIYSSIQYMMNNDFKTEDMSLSFGFINAHKYSDDIAVTNNNKQVFLELLLNYYGYQKSSFVTNEFLTGFYSVVPQELINILSVEDIEKLLVGSKNIDIVDWRINTGIVNQSIFNSHIIEWFWETIGKLDQQKLRKFLQFCTGGQSIPIGGFSQLKNNRQEPSPFTLKLITLRSGMIRAHTCFNRIELPFFETKDELEAAINFILDQKQFIFDFE